MTTIVQDHPASHRTSRTVWIYVLACTGIGLLAGFLAPTTLTVPAPDPSLAELGEILRSNLTLLLALAAATGLQRLALKEAEGPGRPWIRYFTDLAVAAFLALNLFAVGFAVGQLGNEALIRIIPHAWLEVPAFGIGVWAYLQARAGNLAARLLISCFASATVLLVAAAIVETYVTGRI